MPSRMQVVETAPISAGSIPVSEITSWMQLLARSSYVPIEVHAAGISGVLSVFPLLLGTSQLVSFQVKEDSADAAGSGVDRH